MKSYALWEVESRNLVQDFDNEHDALALVWENIKLSGPAIADTLALYVEDDTGEMDYVASGKELAERARRALGAMPLAG